MSGCSFATASWSAVGVTDLRDDVVAVLAEHARQAFPEEDGVVGDHDAHGISAAARAFRRRPRLATTSRPPCASRRSASPRSPDPALRIGAAAAVVHDLEHELSVFPHGTDPDVCGVGVLDRVRERLADEEVAGRLDLGRQALVEPALHPYVQRRP